MLKYIRTTVFISVGIVLLISCNENQECTDCGGGILDGYIYKTVTTEDLSELGTIPGITLDACIRAKLDLSDEIDIESVTIVDDCCCDEYEL